MIPITWAKFPYRKIAWRGEKGRKLTNLKSRLVQEIDMYMAVYQVLSGIE